MKKIPLEDIVTYFFILLLVYTGVAKLSESTLFREQLISSPLLGFMAGLITWALPIGELLLAVALMIPAFRLPALYTTLVLMAIFTVYVVIILSIDDHLSCSCGGIIENLSPQKHVLFNGACVILAGMAIANTRKQIKTRRFRWMTGTSAIALFILLGWIMFTIFSAPATIKTGMEGRPLPAFTLLLADSTTHLNTADIPNGQPFIVIGFSPWCTHCQAETRDILRNIQQFKNIHIYYITFWPFGQMKSYYEYFKLKQYPNITMGEDPKNIFMPYFKANGVPYTLIFDSQKRLKQAFPGQVSAENLARWAAE